MKTAIVIGAGIVGLATARALARKGYAVKVFERHPQATGASVRNFGMLWPIGQPSGKLYQRALRSREIWKGIGESGAFWHEQAGSLHLAYHADEWQVLQELEQAYAQERGLQLLSKEAVMNLSPVVNAEGLIGGLYSATEMIVDPREAIFKLPQYLAEKENIQFYWNKCVSAIRDGIAYVGEQESFAADIIFVCSGVDFETLYPTQFQEWPVTKCKLQMMRLESQLGLSKMGPALCGGLSLLHYKSFEAAASLPALKSRIEQEMPDYLKWGIHVMVCQHGSGELTVGDSHEYGSHHDPFDRDFINRMIVDYLRGFASFQNWRPVQSWHGIYAKCTNGDSELFLSPEPGVYLLNGLGGAGMTLSFGLAEEVIEAI